MARRIADQPSHVTEEHSVTAQRTPSHWLRDESLYETTGPVSDGSSAIAAGLIELAQRPSAPLLAEALGGLGTGDLLPEAIIASAQGMIARDLSEVRVHDHARSHALSERFNARAFAFGQDIAFGAGEFNPQSSEGKRLILHELAHLDQDTRGDVQGFDVWEPGVAVGRADNAFERQAQAVADRGLREDERETFRDRPIKPWASTTGFTVQRETKDDRRERQIDYYVSQLQDNLSVGFRTDGVSPADQLTYLLEEADQRGIKAQVLQRYNRDGDFAGDARRKLDQGGPVTDRKQVMDAAGPVLSPDLFESALTAEIIAKNYAYSNESSLSGSVDVTKNAKWQSNPQAFGEASGLRMGAGSLVNMPWGLQVRTAAPVMAGEKDYDYDPKQSVQMMFRGTEGLEPFWWQTKGEGSQDTVLSDFDPRGIGKSVMDANDSTLKEMALVNSYLDPNGKIDVGGHSLGGGLSQEFAADNPKIIDNIYTFNSPGVNRASAKSIRDYNKNPENSGNPIDSYHFRSYGDAVPTGGQEFTPGEIEYFDPTRSTDNGQTWGTYNNVERQFAGHNDPIVPAYGRTSGLTNGWLNNRTQDILNAGYPSQDDKKKDEKKEEKRIQGALPAGDFKTGKEDPAPRLPAPIASERYATVFYENLGEATLMEGMNAIIRSGKGIEEIETFLQNAPRGAPLHLSPSSLMMAEQFNTIGPLGIPIPIKEIKIKSKDVEAINENLISTVIGYHVLAESVKYLEENKDKKSRKEIQAALLSFRPTDQQLEQHLKDEDFAQMPPPGQLNQRPRRSLSDLEPGLLAEVESDPEFLAAYSGGSFSSDMLASYENREGFVDPEMDETMASLLESGELSDEVLSLAEASFSNDLTSSMEAGTGTEDFSASFADEALYDSGIYEQTLLSSTDLGLEGRDEERLRNAGFSEEDVAAYSESQALSLEGGGDTFTAIPSDSDWESGGDAASAEYSEYATAGGSDYDTADTTAYESDTVETSDFSTGTSFDDTTSSNSDAAYATSEEMVAFEETPQTSTSSNTDSFEEEQWYI